MRIASLALATVAAALPLRAQTPAAPTIPPAAEQIAAAILPLPNDLRAGAKVLGYKTGTKLELLRDGRNGMTCLALYVHRRDFHVACYHDGLEPFMARGRELREQGVVGDQVDTVRFAEIKGGKLKMPPHGSLYSLTGAKSGWDAATGKLTGARPLTVLYMPFATPESTGLSGSPTSNGPWLMLPGTAKAHVMMVGSMGNQ
jgi:hypothetical protein